MQAAVFTHSWDSHQEVTLCQVAVEGIDDQFLHPLWCEADALCLALTMTCRYTEVASFVFYAHMYVLGSVQNFDTRNNSDLN